MKIFLIKTAVFVFIIIAILYMSLFWIKNQSINESTLGSLPDKHMLLENAKSPKIIFVGGSNLPYSLDSSRISEEFQMPVVNMGINAGIGLRYMMYDTLPFVKKNDVVVLIPEYEHFYSSVYYGNMDLVPILFDIFPQGKQFISIQQWQKLAPYVFKYAAKKIVNIPRNLINKYEPKSTIIGDDERRSFNNFGDVNTHWGKESKIVGCSKKSAGQEKVNEFVLSDIKKLKNNLQKRGAYLVLLPPAYQECSFNNQQYIINKIETKLKETELAYLTAPLLSRFSDNLFYDSTYHLTKQGVDLRTTRVIEDLRKQIRK